MKLGDLVAVYWEDIQGFSEWSDMDDHKPVARCVDYGRITRITEQVIEVSGSLGDHAGDSQKSSVAAIPMGCVKLVVRIREPRAPRDWPVWRG